MTAYRVAVKFRNCNGIVMYIIRVSSRIFCLGGNNCV